MSIERGLSNNSVRAIHKDATGFMWFGTADGLNRFDGHDFVSFFRDPSDATSLWSNNIRAIDEDSEGVLWIGTTAGVNRYDPFSLTWSRVVGIPEVADVMREENDLWIATPTGLYRYDLSRRQLDTIREDSSSQFLPSVQRCGDRFVYSGSGRLFVGTDPSTLQMIENTGTVSSAFCAPVAGANAVANYVSASGTWSLLNDNSVARLSDSGGRVALIDSANDVWTGGPQGLFRAGDDRSSFRVRLDPSDSRALSNDVWALAEDEQGGLWVGTLGGLFRVDFGEPLFWAEPAIKGVAVSAILVEGNSAWFGTIGAGLIHFRDGAVVRRYRGSSGGIPGDIVWTAHRDGSGRLWIGTNLGLAVLDEKTSRFLSVPLPQEAAGPSVNVVASDGRGGLYIGGSGLMHIRKGATKVDWIAGSRGGQKPGPSNVQAIHVRTDRTVWVGDEFNFLFRVDFSPDGRGAVNVTDSEALFPGLDLPLRTAVRDIVEGSDGTLWLASESGLIAIEADRSSARIWTMADGLPSNLVFGIVNAADNLWLSTGRGLALFNTEQAEVESLRENRDLTSAEFNRRARFMSDDGQLWFGGSDGIVRFRPNAYLGASLHDEVVVTRIQKTKGSGLVEISSLQGMRSGITLRPGEQFVGFDYAVLDFGSNPNHNYVYRLVGASDEWTSTGQSRSVRFSGLSPGRYEFQIAVASPGSAPAGKPAVVAVRVLPRMWQTWWFKVLASIGLVAALITIHRTRVSRLLHVERMRNQIAGDLHDEIGSNLSSIALLSDLVSADEQTSAISRRRLGIVSETARRMVSTLREIVWAVDPNKDRYSDLVEYLRETAESLCEGRDLRFSATSSDEGLSLGLEKRRAITLIFKEAIANAVRHSGSERIAVSIDLDPGLLSIEVADYGSGFNPENPGNAGYGIPSMQSRARSIGGELELTSSETGDATGTTLVLRVPMKRSPR